MGRWSRKLADAMLDALALPRSLSVLDAGCGTGALADALAVRDPAARITGIDISPAFLEAARARVPCGDFRQGDLTALDLPDAAFDAALSLLVLQFVPDRAKAVAEMVRVTKPGGLVAAAMWDFTGRFAFLRAFADSVAITEPEGEAFRARYWADPVGAPGRMAALFEVAGIEQVRNAISPSARISPILRIGETPGRRAVRGLPAPSLRRYRRNAFPRLRRLCAVPIWPAAQMGRVPLSRLRVWQAAGRLFALDPGSARQSGVMFNLSADEGFHFIRR